MIPVKGLGWPVVSPDDRTFGDPDSRGVDLARDLTPNRSQARTFERIATYATATPMNASIIVRAVKAVIYTG